MDIVGVRIEKKTGSARNIAVTVSYPDKVDAQDPSEKILYESSFINCSSDDRMIAHAKVAQRLSKSKDVLEHLVFSFAKHLLPSKDDCEKVVFNAMQATGCMECPTKWTVHKNTENIHIHIIVVRANKDDPSKIVKPSWLIDKVNKAAAKAIYELALETGPNAPFIFDGNRFIRGGRFDGNPLVSRNAQSFEVHTCQKSFERKAKETLSSLINEVKINEGNWTWLKLHSEVNGLGYRLEASKGGLVFIDQQTGEGTKGSNLQFSRKQSEKLLGQFEAQILVNDSQSPVVSRQTSWQQYLIEKAEFYKLRKSQLSDIGRRFDEEVEKLRQSNFDHRRHLTAIDASIIEHAFSEADFRTSRLRILQQKKKAREQLQSNRFDSWEVFKKRRGIVDTEFTPLKPKNVDLGEIYALATSVEFDRKDIRAFKVRSLPTGVEYSNCLHDPAFVDFGQKIVIHACLDDEALLAALQLASVKWPNGFLLEGSDDFKKRCLEIALDEGTANKIFNTEASQLIATIQTERRTTIANYKEQGEADNKFENPSKKKSTDSSVPPEVENIGKGVTKGFLSDVDKFEQFSQSEKLRAIFKCLGADRLRVCSEKSWLDEEGHEQSEWKYFGDRDKSGHYAGLTFEKICHRLPEFKSKWQTSLKQSFALEPLSDTHQVVVLSGMSHQSVEKIIGDGYKPALIVENEPESYQVVLKAPKLGFSLDQNKQILYTLHNHFQALYGSRAELRVAFPGFDNLRIQTLAGYFQPRLHWAERCDCGVLLDLSTKTAKNITGPTLSSQPVAAPISKPSERSVSCQETANFAYSSFIEELSGLNWPIMQVDEEISTRMVVLGFNPDQIVESIAVNRAQKNTIVKHNWSIYAEQVIERVAQTQMARVEALAESHLSHWQENFGLLPGNDDDFVSNTPAPFVRDTPREEHLAGFKEYPHF